MGGMVDLLQVAQLWIGSGMVCQGQVPSRTANELEGQGELACVCQPVQDVVGTRWQANGTDKPEIHVNNPIETNDRTRTHRGDVMSRTIDKLPPHDEPAELGVLSCILQDPVASFLEIGHHLSKESFYVVKNQMLFLSLKSKYDKGEVIDIITVQQTLKDAGQLDRLGGVTWLLKVQEVAPSAANLPAYIEIVREKLIRRRMIQNCKQVSDWAMGDKPIVELMTQTGTMFDFDAAIDSLVLDGSASGQQMIDDLERRFNLNGALSGLGTGFYKLDSITEGLQFGEQSIIGARPSMGKTAIGLNIFQHNVFTNEVPSLFISLEMSVAALMRRMLSSFSEITMGDIRRGTYTPEQFAHFSTFKNAAAHAPLHILNGTGGMSISEIEYHVRRYVRLHRIKFVVIDYLQKVRATIKQEKKTYEVGNVSERLKGLADETGVAMLTLAQLNREPDKDKGRLPRLNDLADSGQIERDADFVGLLHRNKMNPSDEDGLYIAKQRDGEIGFVPLDFEGQFCRFKNKSVAPADPGIPAPNYQPPQPQQGEFLEAPVED